jgi:hypothetical protein
MFLILPAYALPFIEKYASAALLVIPTFNLPYLFAILVK